ncbi:glycosyltransferase family 2 protein [Clostridium sp. DJ247]|uniref:glycosyltransferase n=1 Tax=Clostridium sp. DJ247 TaxID=2726188 RepID=UPI0016266997|nr:glycosyltransferase [Clostridium sp. DJ247]MBC2580276.1 glycosyltransferase [Clostridium sp. DJ247]
MLEQIAKERVLLKKIREKCNKTSQPEVSVIISTNKLKYIDNIFMNYIKLSYPYKELIVILNNNNLDINDYKIRASNLKDVRIFQLDESCTLGECLNFGIEQSRYNYISKIDDDDYYGPNYLLDLMNAFKYTDAKVVGKASSFVYFEDNNTLYIRDHYNQYKYVDVITGSTILAKKEVFEKVKFKNFSLGEDTQFLIDCGMAGIKIFAADKFNYVCIRHKDLQEHTWRVHSQDIRSFCDKFLATTNFIPFVTI